MKRTIAVALAMTCILISPDSFLASAAGHCNEPASAPAKSGVGAAVPPAAPGPSGSIFGTCPVFDGAVAGCGSRLDESLQTADLAVGTTGQTHGSWDSDRIPIYTEASVSVDDSIKGTPTRPQIPVRVLGGEADGITLHMTHAPSLSTGEKSVACAEGGGHQRPGLRRHAGDRG